eukprot:1356750-Prymnesium_polylepis.1
MASGSATAARAPSGRHWQSDSPLCKSRPSKVQLQGCTGPSTSGPRRSRPRHFLLETYESSRLTIRGGDAIRQAYSAIPTVLVSAEILWSDLGRRSGSDEQRSR